MSVVIASAVRTPIGAFQGAFASLKASQLGAAAVTEALSRAELSVDGVDQVFMGNVPRPARARRPRGKPHLRRPRRPHPERDLNKMCGSGLEAIIQAARAGSATPRVVAGGMESMTNALPTAGRAVACA